MKTKAIVATLLVAVAVAVSAHARLAPPYPRKPLPPDESGHWIVINGNAWSYDVKSKLATAKKSPPIKEKFRTSGKRFHVL